MRTKFSIVMADDDLDDQELIRNAFKDAKIPVDVSPVYDGVQLMDLLLKRYKYAASKAPLPDLIFLDLNMPLMDGFEALRQIKQNPAISDIPVYVVTTSRSDADQKMAIALGATGFYSKGASSSDISRIVKEVCYDCFA